MKNLLKLALAACVLTAPLPAFADATITQRAAAVETAKFQADRANILAMAGTFKVKFDFREQTAWQADYTPIEPKTSGGHEVVRVIEDTGRRIVLQHILVVEVEGQTMLVKHWRQDWTYEPTTMLVYERANRWKLEATPPELRSGRWSQTVWQTDDSPRYGALGEWSDEGGVPRWRSRWTWRPLARRDAIRNPVYDRYMAINRHSPTPNGWIHWQDNMKMGIKDGKLVPFVQELTLNTYTRFDGFNAGAADAYWAKTKDYWAAVRSDWDAVIARNNGIYVPEEAQAGSTSGPRLMGLADEINEGKITTAVAVIAARAIIAEVTTLPAQAAAIKPSASAY
jgi:hypothetical protein